MLEMKSVYSSHIAEVGYDPGTKDLVVVWDNGKKSLYADVPKDIADRVVNAPSVGKALNDAVKGVYKHQYMGDT